MDLESTLKILKNCKPVLQARLGLSALSLFGSTTRDSATENSDIDILVDFDGVATSKQFFGVQFYLEDMLGKPVDLVTSKALRKELKPYIDKDRIDV
ncbi:nucleotidyltransferase family protein [Thalassolituus oleivorans]|uniref:nucleotidyltransferase family protein n=1 Tax=Thalassolituus oleivorans TaxID=187493 RepID=UPI0023F506CA|nr:nucleotidyltransferase family protein [Thalassolituus oleivorans]